MRALAVFGIFLATCCGVLIYRHTGLQQFTNGALIESMRDQHIVMIGDSLMRYQYLSLINLLHTGKFPSETAMMCYNPGLQYIRDEAHKIFGTDEYADVVRGDLFGENRHYHDKERNISIFFYLYWGEMWTTHGNSIPDPNAGWGARKSYNWTYVGILPLLANLTMHFYPPPSTLILNAGFHPHKYDDPHHRKQIADAVLGKIPRVIWKTTNCKRTGVINDTHCDARPHDMHMCSMPGFECFNIGWTKYLREDDYWDLIHFRPHVYSEVNIQMIQQLVTGESIVYTPLQGINNTVVKTSDATPALQFAVDDRGLIRYGVHLDSSNDTTANCTEVASFVRELNSTPVSITLAELLKHVAGDAVPAHCLPNYLHPRRKR
jgi:hypothetical protein